MDFFALPHFLFIYPSVYSQKPDTQYSVIVLSVCLSVSLMHVCAHARAQPPPHTHTLSPVAVLETELLNFFLIGITPSSSFNHMLCVTWLLTNPIEPEALRHIF